MLIICNKQDQEVNESRNDSCEQSCLRVKKLVPDCHTITYRKGNKLTLPEIHFQAVVKKVFPNSSLSIPIHEKSLLHRKLIEKSRHIAAIINVICNKTFASFCFRFHYTIVFDNWAALRQVTNLTLPTTVVKSKNSTWVHEPTETQR